MTATYAANRLEATQDAGNKSIGTEHDLNNRRETVTDRMGHVSKMDYDAYGNVTRTERLGKSYNALGQWVDVSVVSTSTYDLNSKNPEQPTSTTVYPNGPNAPGLTTTYGYDDDGNMTGVKEPYYPAQVMTYERGRLDKSFDASGDMVLDNDYDGKGRLTQSRVPWKRDASNNIVYSATQYVFEATNSSPVPNRIVDALGNATAFTYNGSKGNVTGVTRVNSDGGPNSVSEFEYDGNGNKTLSRSYRTIDGARRALASTMVYDGEERLTSATSPLGVAGGGKSISRYNKIGKVYESARAAGTAKEQTTSHDYDVLGRRKSTTYPDGTSTRVVYNDNDQVERSFDRSGRSSSTVYDGLNRAVGSRLYGANGALVTYPNSSNAVETLSVYDGAERAIASRDERGHWSRTVYDDAARTTRSEDEVTALNGSTQLLTSTTVLDDDGRTAYTLDPQGTRTEWRYDDAGRMLETHLDVRYNNGARTIYARGQTSYDVLGRAIKETNPSQQWKSYDYDSLGRLRAVMQPQDDNAARNMVTRFGYDEAGLKLWQQDAKGYEQDGRPALTTAPQARVTRFAYDVAGRSVARQMPELVNGDYLIERTGYDELGRVDTHTDFRGFTTRMSYDVRGRILSKVPDSRLNEKGLYMGYPDEFTTVASRGNGAGALVTTSISDASRGWLRSVESPTGTLTYDYDAGGNRTSVTHSRGSESFTTNYGYDELSRLTNVSDGTTELARIGYDLNGNREQVRRANGVNTGYTFDSLNRLDKLTHAKGQTVLSSFDYAVRQDGKRTGVSESVVNDQTAATPRTSSRDVGFTYDDAGRLTKEDGKDGLGVSYENAWQYDAAGNRTVTTYTRATVEAPNTVATTTTIAAVFSGNDWLREQTSTVKTAAATSATTTFYGYDRNGAQTHERVGALSCPFGRATRRGCFEGEFIEAHLRRGREATATAPVERADFARAALDFAPKLVERQRRDGATALIA